MKAQEIADELGQPGAQQLLREAALARLAYNGRDGLPGVIPDESARPDFEAQVRATSPKMARIAITPGWARFYDFGAGRLPGFLRQLVSGE